MGDRSLLYGFVRDWLAELFDGPVYHYTSLLGFCGILDSLSLWATDVRYLNDISEYHSGIRRIRQAFEAALATDTDTLNRTRNALDVAHGPMRQVAVACFSSKGDDLSQWRAYARESPGVALGFDSSRLKSVAHGQDVHLVRVLYDERIKAGNVDALVRQLVQDAKSVVAGLMTDSQFAERVRANVPVVAAMIKDAAFAEESEVRLLLSRDANEALDWRVRATSSMLIPYVSIRLGVAGGAGSDVLPLNVIRTGPSENPELLKHSVELESVRTGHRVSVEKSAIPLRNWR